MRRTGRNTRTAATKREAAAARCREPTEELSQGLQSSLQKMRCSLQKSGKTSRPPLYDVGLEFWATVFLEPLGPSVQV